MVICARMASLALARARILGPTLVIMTWRFVRAGTALGKVAPFRSVGGVCALVVLCAFPAGCIVILEVSTALARFWVHCAARA